MKFALDLVCSVDGDTTSLAKLPPSVVEGLQSASIIDLEGRLVLSLNGKEIGGDYSDPIVRLVDLWLRKLPWIIGGDTETVALRNSEHCFAFVPTGDSVELSFFTGTETEIEEYVVEPFNIRLELFVNEVLKVGSALLSWCEQQGGSIAGSEDVVDLRTSMGEAKAAWRDYQLHQRR